MTRILCLIAAITAYPFAAAAEPRSAEDIVQKELSSYYQTGKDFQAKVRMRLVDLQGSRARVMNFWRINVGNDGDQRYLITFDAPADVRGMGFLVWKYARKEDDRWLYFPALKAVKRVAADDKRSSFVGSDFTYEDISGRDLDEEQHVLLRSDNLGDRPAFVVSSTPKSPATYARRVSWIDSERFLPLKEEYYDAEGKLQREFHADKVENVGGHWTVTARSMTNSQTGHRTEVIFQSMGYDSDLTAAMFSEGSLRSPPALAP